MNKKALAREENTRIIIDHAEKLFAEKGFNGTTTQEIADRAGLPKANIHYYFKTKQDLYTVVLKDILSDWIHDADIFKISDDPETSLRAYIQKKMQHSFDRPNGSKVWAMEIIQGGPVFGEEIKQTLINWDTQIVSHLQKWMDEGKTRAVDPQALLNLIWATTQHYADFEYQIRTLNKGKPFSENKKKEVIDNVCEIILAGVLL